MYNRTNENDIEIQQTFDSTVYLLLILDINRKTSSHWITENVYWNNLNVDQKL